MMKGDFLAGKYQLHEPLGTGGMSTVTEATDVTLGRKVAVKFLRVTGDAYSQERLRREAIAIARLDSKHIVKLFEADFTEAGALFLVMERLEGFDLSKHVRENGPLPMQDAVHYALQVCEALAHAHSAKIVHRDVKPSNMFVAIGQDGSETLKLLDFGIALNRGATNPSNLTQDDLLGSPTFMSPEQLRDPTSVDARSDIWSLGVTLHRMLTGGLPFEADNLGALVAKIFDREPVPISSFPGNLPKELERCILRCLSKRPADRFGSVLELAEALVPFGPKEPSRALLVGIAHVFARTKTGSSRSKVSAVPRATPAKPLVDDTVRDLPPELEATLDSLSDEAVKTLRAFEHVPPTIRGVETTAPLAGAEAAALKAARKEGVLQVQGERDLGREATARERRGHVTAEASPTREGPVDLSWSAKTAGGQEKRGSRGWTLVLVLSVAVVVVLAWVAFSR